MIKELQQSLNKQAEALNARSPAIRPIRREFDQLLEKLQLQLGADAAALAKQLKAQNAAAAKDNETAARIESVRDELARDEMSARVDAAQLELKEVEKQLHILLQRKSELLESLANQKALHESHRRRLTSLVSSLEAGREASRIEFDARATADLENKHNQTQAHLEACIRGRELWAQVCTELAAADKRVSSSNLGTSLVALEETAQKLFTHREYAKAQNWQLLVTAIGHEYTAVEVALDAVRRVSGLVKKTD